MSTPVVELAEYQELEVELSAAAERTLRAVAGHRLSTAPGGPGCYRIRASSHVGAITTPAVQVIVRPKVAIPTLLYLLESDGEPLALAKEEVALAGASDLVAALATLYERQLRRLVRRGLARRYVELTERLPTVRGRIAVGAQQRSGGLGLPITCMYDEYQTDTRLNRRARAAAVRLLRMPGVPAPTARGLSRLLPAFEEVGDLRGDDLTSRSQFTRLDEHYGSTDALAELVLRNASVEVRSGLTLSSAFTVDMNVIFERFVALRLQRLLRGRLVVDMQRRTHLDWDRRVPIRPDLVFRRPGGADVLVGDTKYKIAAAGLGRETDYYQLLAYATALQLPVGVLIYCAENDAAVPRRIAVGRPGTTLLTWSLDLSAERRHIDESVAQLSSFIKELAAY